MREFLNVYQRPGERRRRCFVDKDFELVVWFEESGEIARFELSYDLQRYWRALRWHKSTGITHHTVDDGEGRPQRNALAMLSVNPNLPPVEVYTTFDTACRTLEPAIAQFVIRKLNDFRAELDEV